MRFWRSSQLHVARAPRKAASQLGAVVTQPEGGRAKQDHQQPDGRCEEQVDEVWAEYEKATEEDAADEGLEDDAAGGMLFGSIMIRGS